MFDPACWLLLSSETTCEEELHFLFKMRQGQRATGVNIYRGDNGADDPQVRVTTDGEQVR